MTRSLEILNALGLLMLVGGTPMLFLASLPYNGMKRGYKKATRRSRSTTAERRRLALKADTMGES